jgi:hypothetical protein
MTMHDRNHQTTVQRRLEQMLIAFFVVCALFAVVVYIVAPSIYTTALKLAPTATDRYPLPTTLFLVALLGFMAVVIYGIVHHWRWLFWLLLLAFGFSILEVPTTILQLMGSLPDTFSFPAWYSLSRMGVALLEVALAVWMAQIYRHYGVWAMGKKSSKVPNVEIR